MADFLTRLLDRYEPPNRGGGDPAFFLRLVTAFILVPVAVLIAVQGGWVLAAWVGFFAVAMSYEWIAMSDTGAQPRAYSLFAAVAFGSVALAGAGVWLWALGVVLGGVVIMTAERHARANLWRGAFGVLYVCLPCLALIWLRNGDAGGLKVLFYLFSVVWAADSAAYFSGTWLGGPRLFPKASPNKTWTGLIGGLLAGTITGFIAVNVMADAPGNHVFWISFSVMLALAAVLGDLLESSLKRRFGVKDAGTLVPGHGGVLDRVDALMGAVLLCAAVMYLWPQMFEPLGRASL